MGQVVRRIRFLFCACAAVLVIGGLHFFLRKEQMCEVGGIAPLERGFATTGKVCSFLSLQFFTILILFLVLDLEIVFVVAFLLRGTAGKGLSMWFVFLIFVSL